MKKFLRSLAFWAMTLAGGLYGANAHAAGLPMPSRPRTRAEVITR